MKKIILSNLIDEIESGSRPKGGVSGDKGNIPSLGAEHLDGDGSIRFTKAKFIEQTFFDSMKRGLIKKNDILIVKDGATTGKVSYIDEKFPFKKAAINEHVFRLAINQNKALPKYVFRFLASSFGKTQILSDFRGATVGGISQGFADKVFIPLPDVKEQDKIVYVLDKADKLRQNRRKTIQLLDDFLCAVFFKMFGDPFNNEKQWAYVQLKDLLVNIENGESPICEGQPRIHEDDWAVLKLSAVTYCRFRPNENKRLPKSVAMVRRVEVKKGMLLLTRKNTYELVGASAFVFQTPNGLLLPDTIFNLIYKKEIVFGEYLWKLFTNSNFKKKIHLLATGTAGSMPNISKQKLMSLKIPLPPIDKQKKYAVLVNHVEIVRQRMINNSDEMDNQFNALMQKYFYD